MICGVLVKEDAQSELLRRGVKDSKLLTPKRREILFDEIISLVDKYEVIVISPQEIDAALSDQSMNLNWLEAEASSTILNKLLPDRAILDCPSPNTSAYKRYVAKRTSCELLVEHKADLNHVCVGAASIIAKVTRDREINLLKARYGDFGSGYTSDPGFCGEEFREVPGYIPQDLGDLQGRGG